MIDVDINNLGNINTSGVKMSSKRPFIIWWGKNKLMHTVCALQTRTHNQKSLTDKAGWVSDKPLKVRRQGAGNIQLRSLARSRHPDAIPRLHNPPSEKKEQLKSENDWYHMAWVDMRDTWMVFQTLSRFSMGIWWSVFSLQLWLWLLMEDHHWSLVSYHGMKDCCLFWRQ